MQPKPWAEQWRVLWLPLACGLTLGAGLFISPECLWATPVWFAVIALSSKKQWIRALLVLCTPAAFVLAIVLSASVDFARGHAFFRAVGLPGPEFGNLDRTLRIGWVTGGCTDRGPEAPRTLHNATLRFLGRMFGPMPGSYRGPIPNREEAFLLASGAAIRLTAMEVERGEIRVGKSTHQFDSSSIRGMRTSQCDWSVHVLVPGTVVVGCRAEQTVDFVAVVELEHGSIVASYFREDNT